LPFLDYDALYRRYSFAEPWNGPHNRLLAKEMPYLYRSPFVGPDSTITQYVGIAGKGTPWQGTAPQPPAPVENCEPTLIWLVEAANSDINWMEPRDFPLEQALVGINVPGGGGIQSNYPFGLPAALMPVQNCWVPADIKRDAFRAMLTLASEGDKANEKATPGAQR